MDLDVEGSGQFEHRGNTSYISGFRDDDTGTSIAEALGTFEF